MSLVCPVGHPQGVGTTYCRLCGRDYLEVDDAPVAVAASPVAVAASPVASATTGAQPDPGWEPAGWSLPTAPPVGAGDNLPGLEATSQSPTLPSGPPLQAVSSFEVSVADGSVTSPFEMPGESVPPAAPAPVPAAPVLSVPVTPLPAPAPELAVAQQDEVEPAPARASRFAALKRPVSLKRPAKGSAEQSVAAQVVPTPREPAPAGPSAPVSSGAESRLVLMAAAAGLFGGVVSSVGVHLLLG